MLITVAARTAAELEVRSLFLGVFTTTQSPNGFCSIAVAAIDLNPGMRCPFAFLVTQIPFWRDPSIMRHTLTTVIQKSGLWSWCPISEVHFSFHSSNRVLLSGSFAKSCASEMFEVNGGRSLLKRQEGWSGGNGDWIFYATWERRVNSSCSLTAGLGDRVCTSGLRVGAGESQRFRLAGLREHERVRQR